MFTENVKPRKRGRPPGQTAQGAETKDRLYATAMGLITRRGYEATTLREIAKEANVSVGLLYRYFPSKQAVILAFYDELSADFARQAAGMPAWTLARSLHLRAHDEPSCARGAPGRAAGAGAGPGRGSGRGRVFRADGVFAPARAARIRGRRGRSDRRAETATRCSSRPASVPCPPRRPLVVAFR